jgi:hypothetical protein
LAWKPYYASSLKSSLTAKIEALRSQLYQGKPLKILLPRKTSMMMKMRLAQMMSMWTRTGQGLFGNTQPLHLSLIS